jgi:hypothetical protein
MKTALSTLALLVPAILIMDGCGGTGPSETDTTTSQAVTEAPTTHAGGSVAIKLSARRVGAPINSHFAGISQEKGYLARRFFKPASTGVLARLGRSLIRIGGGSCDTHTWTPDGPGQREPQIAPSDVDALATSLEATGWDALYCVNLRDSRPELAAEEVKYVAQHLGSHLVGIEIGNEPDNYHWDVSHYIERWKLFAGAIRAAVPHITIAAPALAEFGHVAEWVPPVLETGLADLVTEHFYIEDKDASSATIDTLLTPAGIPFAGLGRLDSVVRRGPRRVPFRMAETNTFYGGGKPGVSDTLASALWSIDYLFAIAKRGGIGANFHCGGTAQSVLGDDDGVITSLRPLYYGLLMFTLAGDGRVLEIDVDAHGRNVTAHAIAKADGSTSLFVLNKEPSGPVRFTLDLGRDAHASMRILTARGLASRDHVTIQGAEVGLDGSFAPAAEVELVATDGELAWTLAPASVALIDIPR